MSKEAQIEFMALIRKYHCQHKDVLRLSAPYFETNSFITTAIMRGTGGSVELMYGPPEWHVEIFINTLKDERRWSMADLMSIESLRDWLYADAGRKSSNSRAEAEVDGWFCFLIDGIRGVENFTWILE